MREAIHIHELYLAWRVGNTILFCCTKHMVIFIGLAFMLVTQLPTMKRDTSIMPSKARLIDKSSKICHCMIMSVLCDSCWKNHDRRSLEHASFHASERRDIALLPDQDNPMRIPKVSSYIIQKQNIFSNPVSKF